MFKPRKKQKFRSESDLAESIVGWLKNEGWTVFKEVQPIKLSKIADIVAVKDDKIWIIEAKLIYGSKVLEQAFYWSKYADFVSIAVPRTYNKNIVLDFFLKEHGIGRFWVAPSTVIENSGYVFLDVSPKINDNVLKKYIIESLREEHKLSIAGSSGGGYITPYKITIDQIRNLLKEKGKLSINEIVDSIKHHYSNRRSAINTLNKRLLDVEKDFEIIEEEGKKFFSLKI